MVEVLFSYQQTLQKATFQYEINFSIFYLQVQIKESLLHSSQISDLVRGDGSQKSQNANSLKKRKKKKKKPGFPNRNIDNKMKIDNIGHGSTNNNKVEGLTHHVLSSSTSKILSKITFPLCCSVIQILITKLSTHQFFPKYRDLSEYLFWIVYVLSFAFATNFADILMST